MIIFDDDNDNQYEWAAIQTYGNSRIYTGASLTKPDMPKDFTVCAAYMIKAFDFRPWFLLFELNDYGFLIRPYDTYTEYEGYGINSRSDHVLFPFTWIRVCVSVDTVAGRVRLVVNGEMMEDKTIEEDETRPANFSIKLGNKATFEYPGMVSQVNVFSSPLSTSRMVALTEAHGEECGAPGDYVSWEEEDWQLKAQARMEMVDELDGPCMGSSEVTVYTAEFPYHSIATNLGRHSAVTTEAELSGCMEHCEKVGTGRSPPVRTQEEWEWFLEEVKAIVSPDISALTNFWWLAATDGEVEGEWRDAYPPYDLLNTSWSWPWISTVNDSHSGDDHNCMQWLGKGAWNEHQCWGIPRTRTYACLKDVS